MVEGVAYMLETIRRRAFEAYNYRLRTMAGGRWASHCRPPWPFFLLTERCNAKCVHCDIWKNRGQEDSPSVDQWKTVLSDLRAWLGPARVTFTGGEALLKPYTTELTAYASSIGLFLEVLTHGYWFDQSKIEGLAKAKPWMITISLDGIGDLHNKIRGRDKFWEKTSETIETVKRIRKEHQTKTHIRLKNVIMSHNLDGVCEVARYATQDGMDVFYQPIEQNYNTPEDPRWWEHSENWPRNTEKAVQVVEQLIQMKRQGASIGNTYQQLEVMIPYFRDPAAMRLTTTAHSAHERRIHCSALTALQFQSNGDVTTCTAQPPVGNIKTMRIREIWQNRPHWWNSGCCLERRLMESEREALFVPVG